MNVGCPRLSLTNRGEEHVVEEECEGDDEEDELPRVARLVEVRADPRPRQVLTCHTAHCGRSSETPVKLDHESTSILTRRPTPSAKSWDTDVPGDDNKREPEMD